MKKNVFWGWWWATVFKLNKVIYINMVFGGIMSNKIRIWQKNWAIFLHVFLRLIAKQLGEICVYDVCVMRFLAYFQSEQIKRGAHILLNIPYNFLQTCSFFLQNCSFFCRLVHFFADLFIFFADLFFIFTLSQVFEW